jgi:F-type H+-transporting ATPase subunit b
MVTETLNLAASGGNPLAFDLFQYAMAIGVFLVALIVLSRTAWPKITAGLEAREGKIRSEVFAAERLRKEADAAKKDFEKSLAEARAESSRMIEATRAEQARLAADLRVRAEQELTEMREQAKANIEAAKRAAINEIYAHTATIATAVATKILQREVNENDQRRLVDESINQFTHDAAAR